MGRGHGPDVLGISVRIGTAIEPTEFRHLSTWLGYDDLVRLMMRCITVPCIGCMAVWGMSANTRSDWNDAARLGYRPMQDGEDCAAESLCRPNPLDPVAQRYPGGAFVTIDETPPDQCPTQPVA